MLATAAANCIGDLRDYLWDWIFRQSGPMLWRSEMSVETITIINIHTTGIKTVRWVVCRG
jgi:hypothetical protein